MFRNTVWVKKSALLAALLAISATSHAGGVYRFNGSLFDNIPGSLSQVSVGADGLE